MTKPDISKTLKPTPVVEDPHPGSISDGTHPAAREHKQPKPATAGDAAERISGSGEKADVKERQTDVNSEAPKHPNKGAYGS
jgi:hypothetical protein